MGREPRDRIEELTTALDGVRADLDDARRMLDDARQRLAQTADVCHAIGLKTELARRGCVNAPATGRSTDRQSEADA